METEVTAYLADPDRCVLSLICRPTANKLIAVYDQRVIAACICALPVT